MKRRVRVELALGLVVALMVIGWWLASGRTASGPRVETPESDGGSTPVSATGGPGAAPQARAAAQGSDDAGASLPVPAGAEVVARFGWGSGDEALGRERQQEGNPEAPMSVTVAPDGTVVVLDQVNQRLVRLDAKGRRLGSTPLPVQAGQDVVVTRDGTALVLDRLVDKSVAIIGPDGKPRGELPIEGKGLTEGGASTGLFHDGDDVLVEREHGDLVRIGKTDGKADPERGEVPGRPSKDGAGYLTAVIVSAPQGLVAVTSVAKATLEHRFTRQVAFGQPLLAIVMLDSDAAGLAYVAAHVELPGSTPDALRLGVSVRCLDGRDGAPLGGAIFPANTDADETFRELSVTPDGAILFLRRAEHGSQLERYRCQ